jgi:hypothetical protein
MKTLTLYDLHPNRFQTKGVMVNELFNELKTSTCFKIRGQIYNQLNSNILDQIWHQICRLIYTETHETINR